jgi:lysozyme family protein
MAVVNADDIITGIIQREGGFVNDPADAGGPTNWGITQSTLAHYRMRPVTVEEVEHLSITEARAIYRERYIVGPGFDQIKDERLLELVVDSAVQHGVVGAVRLLQAALGVAVDGVFGDATRAALAGATPGQLWIKLAAERVAYYGRIITDKPVNAKFAAGWMARMRDLIVAFVS